MRLLEVSTTTNWFARDALELLDQARRPGRTSADDEHTSGVIVALTCGNAELA